MSEEETKSEQGAVVSLTTLGIPNIPKFNGKNYVAWCFTLKLVLIKKKVWDLVKPGDTTVKRPNGTGQEQTAWDSKNAEAFTTICFALEEAYLKYVMSTEMAAEAWDAISKRFKANV